MPNLFIVILLLLVALIVWSSRNGVPLPKPFRARSCQGVDWRRLFPGASKEDIRVFLSLFTQAFSYHARHRLKFNPKDNILDIYRAQYPHPWQPDGLELEMFGASIEKTYGVRLAEVWNEGLTLGELFAHTRSDSRSTVAKQNT